MDYTVMEKNGITLINLQGQIDVTVAPKLRDLIRDLIEKGHIKIAINMKKVDFIDSSGLGIFVIAFKLINEKGGVIKLINMNDQVKQLFKVTKLLQHFEIVKQQ